MGFCERILQLVSASNQAVYDRTVTEAVLDVAREEARREAAARELGNLAAVNAAADEGVLAVDPGMTQHIGRSLAPAFEQMLTEE